MRHRDSRDGVVWKDNTKNEEGRAHKEPTKVPQRFHKRARRRASMKSAFGGTIDGCVSAIVGSALRSSPLWPPGGGWLTENQLNERSE